MRRQQNSLVIRTMSNNTFYNGQYRQSFYGTTAEYGCKPTEYHDRASKPCSFFRFTDAKYKQETYADRQTHHSRQDKGTVPPPVGVPPSRRKIVAMNIAQGKSDPDNMKADEHRALNEYLNGSFKSDSALTEAKRLAQLVRHRGARAKKLMRSMGDLLNQSELKTLAAALFEHHCRHRD